MSTLAEIENAIERLNPPDRAKLAQWLEQNFDPDEGLELREGLANELENARKEITRGDTADWEQLKHPGKAASR